MEVFGQNPDRIVEGYSEEFEETFLEHVKRTHRFTNVAATVVYNEYIANRHHVQMNSTQWPTLTDFIKYLGRTGKCKVDETPKGWFMAYIDREPETLLKETLKNKRQRAELVDEERHERVIAEQTERAAKTAKPDDDQDDLQPDVLIRDKGEEKANAGQNGSGIPRPPKPSICESAEPEESTDGRGTKFSNGNGLRKGGESGKRRPKDNGGDALEQIMREQEQVKEKLQNAYDKLYKKYQNLKKRQLADVDGAFDEQSERIKAFTTAADDYVETLKKTNSACEYQEEMMNRSRLMEAAYIECQNSLVIERARNLELRQQLENSERSGNKLPKNAEPCGTELSKDSEPCGSKSPENTEFCGSKVPENIELGGSKLPENTELCGSKLLQELLQSALQLTISNFGKSGVILSHDESGYEFKLEHNKLSEELGGKDALLYSVLSLGTILHVAPEWMRSEVVFDMAQVRIFFRRILAVVRSGGVSL